MEIKGFVIDTKSEKKAVLVMRPKGQTAIVKASGKRFEYLLRTLEQGDWVCMVGKGKTDGTIATFSEISSDLGQIGMTDEAVPVICTNCCSESQRTGYCLEVSKETWGRMVDAFSQASGEVAAQKIASATR